MEVINNIILPIIFTSAIIYIWLKIFHEYVNIPKILIVASIANFQNYIIPLIIGFFLRLGINIWNPFIIIPALFWIVLIKLVFRDISFSHAIIIGFLCFVTHTFFEIYKPFFFLLQL
ncbi:MAG TPA: hypothetical protein EYH56_00980 [Nanoarchaeota archaeon]|nr:hypothetical protein [Nanoarchaeota archaeon]